MASVLPRVLSSPSGTWPLRNQHPRSSVKKDKRKRRGKEEEKKERSNRDFERKTEEINLFSFFCPPHLRSLSLSSPLFSLHLRFSPDDSFSITVRTLNCVKARSNNRERKGGM